MFGFRTKLFKYGLREQNRAKNGPLWYFMDNALEQWAPMLMEKELLIRYDFNQFRAAAPWLSVHEDRKLILHDPLYQTQL